MLLNGMSLNAVSCKRAGLALPATIFGMVIIGVLAGGMWVITDLESKSVRNREDAARALQIAEAGAAHAFGILRQQVKDTTLTRLLRGANGTGPNADDGILSGFPGLTGVDIPTAGIAALGGRYWVRLVDNPGDPVADALIDGDWRIVMRCVGQTDNGARAVVDYLVHHRIILPPLAFNGPVDVSGGPQVLGRCAGFYATGNISVGGNNTIVDGYVITAGTYTGGTIRDADGVQVTPFQSAPPVPIPPMPYADYCPAEADYILQSNGWILRKSDNTITNGGGAGSRGWRRTSATPVTWETNADTELYPGTFCVEGSAWLSGNTGLAGVPHPVSVIATGSIQVSGTPFITADAASGVLLVAQGDLKVSGNAVVGVQNFEGTMYGGAQCQLSGTADINGQFLCGSGTNPVGSAEWAATNYVQGDATASYDCGPDDPNRVRRIVSWYQRIGS